jgi:hypothetical protein
VRLLRLRVAGHGSVLVVVRRATDCSLAGRVRVDLDRTRGLVRFSSRVAGRRLRRGVYVLTITRRASGAPLRQVVVRITARHKIVRLPRRATLCLPTGAGPSGVDLLAVLALPFSSPGLPAAGVPTPAAGVSRAEGGGTAPARPKQADSAATAGATAIHLHVPPPLERAAGGGMAATILAGLIVALLVALPAAIVYYVWRFVHAPAPK